MGSKPWTALSDVATPESYHVSLHQSSPHSDTRCSCLLGIENRLRSATNGVGYLPIAGYMMERRKTPPCNLLWTDGHWRGIHGVNHQFPPADGEAIASHPLPEHTASAATFTFQRATTAVAANADTIMANQICLSVGRVFPISFWLHRLFARLPRNLSHVLFVPLDPSEPFHHCLVRTMRHFLWRHASMIPHLAHAR